MMFALVGHQPFFEFPNAQGTSLQYGLYSASYHTFWSVSLCYIIFACYRNSGGVINWFLSHPFWQPLSRLSYAIYVVHYPIIFFSTGSVKSLPVFSEFALIQTGFGYACLSILVAILAALAFDSPIDTIDKLIFGGGKKEVVKAPQTTIPIQSGEEIKEQYKKSQER